MKKSQILKYIDLAPMMYLDHRCHPNGLVVDDATLEVMLRIENTMQRLEVMGEDEKRMLWIEIKAPAKRRRMEEADENGYYWYQVATAQYEGFHYMIITNQQWFYVDLRSASYAGEERKPDNNYYDLSKPLSNLEAYITALVDRICENPIEYHAYLEKCLPYSKRDGIIKRADLNRICPVYRTFKNPERVVGILKRMEALPLWSASEMTLRTYMHFWRLLFQTYYTHRKDSRFSKTDVADKTDEEFFKIFNHKGRATEDLRLDSEPDFLKWQEENCHSHSMDIVYAIVHFIPRKKGEGWGEDDVAVADGQWYLTLSFDVYVFSDMMVDLLEALCDEGIGVVCHESERMLRNAREEDYVGISPRNIKYTNKEVGNTIRLPEVEDGITPQQVADVIAATEWEPIREVRPVKKN